ncbi:hypothetical protein CNEO2_410093 [Clostridium neonatale]|nr:hypothetical protein CNEO2_410093 [Clostridium neonatale]
MIGSIVRKFEAKILNPEDAPKNVCSKKQVLDKQFWNSLWLRI